MERFWYLTALFSFYGALLTEKQQACLRLHLDEDFSLSEIGEALGISRQAVYDNIHRSTQAMEGYEAKLGLVARYAAEREELQGIASAVRDLRTPENSRAVDTVLARLAPLMGPGREV